LLFPDHLFLLAYIPNCSRRRKMNAIKLKQSDDERDAVMDNEEDEEDDE
jgi:hypothetical protein